MERLRVWAPLAKTLEVQAGHNRAVATPEPDGWWSAPAGIGEGVDYGFIINGQGPFPDPRAQRQPFGPHGLSRRVNHAAFRWSDARWQPPPLSSAIIYELHVGTFTERGTFEAAKEKLDHLVQLGV